MSELNQTDLLKQISKAVGGDKLPKDTPQSLRFIYCATANDTTAESELAKYGISYLKMSPSIQTGIDEYRFSCDDATYERLFNDIVNTGLAIYISNSMLPITSAIGSVSVTVASGTMECYSTDGTSANAKFGRVDSSDRVIVAQPTASVLNCTEASASSILTATQSPTTLLDGSKATTSGSALAIGSSTACRKVVVQADYANTDYVLIGNATSQSIRLYAGDSIDFVISDISKIFIKRPAGVNVTINYSAS